MRTSCPSPAMRALNLVQVPEERVEAHPIRMARPRRSRSTGRCFEASSNRENPCPRDRGGSASPSPLHRPQPRHLPGRVLLPRVRAAPGVGPRRPAVALDRLRLCADRARCRHCRQARRRPLCLPHASAVCAKFTDVVVAGNGGCSRRAAEGGATPLWAPGGRSVLGCLS